LEWYSNKGWPFVILNDAVNATIDAQQKTNKIGLNRIKALSGSCIGCSASDACSFMEFLGVGLHNRFLPPIQISVVDVKSWQQRGEHNELEAN
jgi:hypothetical protein